MFQKSAQVQVSFSWIFMVLVGGFFFIMGYNFIDAYKEVEDQKFALEFKDSLKTIFTSAARTSGIESNSLKPLYNTITGESLFSDRQVDMYCDSGFSILDINSGEFVDANNDFIQNYPTFMTHMDLGSGDRAYLAVENYHLPFKISNMMALVSSKNLYLFDLESGISQRFLDKFEKSSYAKLNYDFINFSSDLNTGDLEDLIGEYSLNSVTFVTNDSSSFPFGLGTDFALESGVHLYTVLFSEETEVSRFESRRPSYYGNFSLIDIRGNFDEVNISYYDYDGSMALQTMAVFSNPSIFNCSYTILLNKAVSTFDFFRVKSNLTANLTTQDLNFCSDSTNYILSQTYYEGVSSALGDVISSADKTEKFKNSGNELYNLILTLEESTSRLKDNSCVYVY